MREGPISSARGHRGGLAAVYYAMRSEPHDDSPPPLDLALCPACLELYAPSSLEAYCCPSCWASLTPGERVLMYRLARMEQAITGFVGYARERIAAADTLPRFDGRN